MWIFHKDAALFLAAEPGDDRIMVRSRRQEHIRDLFPGVVIIATPAQDYQFRAMVDRRRVMDVIAEEIGSITYRKFKPQVKDQDLHNVYMKVWSTMLDLQRPEDGGMYNNQMVPARNIPTTTRRQKAFKPF